MSKLDVKKVIIFKHGVSYFVLKGEIKGKGSFELEFKIDEMDDILKSLFVIDTSEKGYISSISYDAALDTGQLLKSIMLDIPDLDSFSSLITQIKGAPVQLTISAGKNLSGTIMGLETSEKTVKSQIVKEKFLVLLQDDNFISKIPFTEIKHFEILSDDIKKDLKFFLDTVITGKKKDAKKILINCESGGADQVERDIFVSYIRESPIWKTSYRLIMSKEQEEQQKCLLSGWCMVENTTNQDWEGIELSLVAGMPVSFRYDFYKPIFIQRPIIRPPKVLSARPTEIEEGLEKERFRDFAMAEEPKLEMARAKKMRAPPAPSAAPAGVGRYQGIMSASLDDDVLEDKVKAQTKTRTKDLGELFEYNISNPVTIKRKQSALVPILTEAIKAKRILLFNMNEYDKNPNACLEITNNTDLILERGPVTIIYDDNLAGEAIIPFLNKDDTRLLNYAIEQAVLINWEQKSEDLSVHKVTFGNGYSYEYYFTDLYTEYKIKNKTKQEKILYLDHPKQAGYKFIEPPLKPEETENYWRFKITLKPGDALNFKLKERRENYSSNYIWHWSRDTMLERTLFYLKHKFIDEKIEKELKEIAELIEKSRKFKETRSKLNEERNNMTDEQARLRENISVLGDDSQSLTLKEKYVTKLTNQENRFEEISSELNDLEKNIEKVDKTIQERVTSLKI